MIYIHTLYEEDTKMVEWFLMFEDQLSAVHCISLLVDLDHV